MTISTVVGECRVRTLGRPTRFPQRISGHSCSADRLGFGPKKLDARRELDPPHMESSTTSFSSLTDEGQTSISTSETIIVG